MKCDKSSRFVTSLFRARNYATLSFVKVRDSEARNTTRIIRDQHRNAWWCWWLESIENARPHRRQSLVKLHKSPRQASSYASEYRWDWKRGWPDGTIAWRHAFHWITWCKHALIDRNDETVHTHWVDLLKFQWQLEKIRDGLLSLRQRTWYEGE